LFKDLPQADLRRIAAQTASRSLGRGEALFSAGQPCEGLYLVVAGLVKLYAKGASGQEKVIEVISAGGCVSEATMFSDSAHRLHAAALADTHVLVVPRELLLAEISHNTMLAMRMLGGLARRFNTLLKDIEAVTLHSAVKRVVDYLLHASSAHGGGPAATPGAATVSLPTSKGTIASLLSVTPEHFSRILHDLQARGLIAVQRRHIHILDARGLAQCA